MESQLLNQIGRSFEGVTLENGISLGEAYAIDYRLGKERRIDLRKIVRGKS